MFLYLLLSTGSSGGLQLRGAPAAASTSNSRLLVFDENKAENVVASESKFEPRLPPPTSRAKENEQKTERWCDVKVRTRKCLCRRFGCVELK